MMEGRIPRDFDCPYFAHLYSTDDTVIVPSDIPTVDDPDDIQNQKMQTLISKVDRKRERLINMKRLIAQPLFKQLEAELLGDLMVLERDHIWRALDKGDEKEILNVRIRHEGIVSFFRRYYDLTRRIKACSAKIAELESKQIIIENKEVEDLYNL